MSPRDEIRRKIALFIWRLFNPLARALAGIAPWWVVLETTGRRSGESRRVPLARGPVDGRVAWLIAVHGEHSAFARNIAAEPRVRLKLRGRWREGFARLEPLDDAMVARFNPYARSGPRMIGIEPKLVRVELDRRAHQGDRQAKPR
ncbi:MAG TPA: nitroreductase/quinone reductase family protein [Solirubrobacterales bacterium]|nr:nitroreductase/quinone reductase family protein [Solirubrobacterales bacterium]